MGMLKKLTNKLTGADKTSAQRYEEDIAKRQKRFDKILKDKESRQKMQGECAAVLDECKTTFSRCINTERARAKKKHAEGFETSTEESRIHEAAIGIMIVDEAKYKLQAISSEADLNLAMNRLGMALRQLRHMDNSAAAISASTERILEDWCPGLVGESADLTSTKLEVPAEMRERIDNDFVDDLMAGSDYATALKMRSYRQAPAKKSAAQAPSQPAAQPAPQADSTSTLVDNLQRMAYGAASGEEPEDISRYKNMI